MKNDQLLKSPHISEQLFFRKEYLDLGLNNYFNNNKDTASHKNAINEQLIVQYIEADKRRTINNVFFYITLFFFIITLYYSQTNRFVVSSLHIRPSMNPPMQLKKTWNRTHLCGVSWSTRKLLPGHCSWRTKG